MAQNVYLTIIASQINNHRKNKKKPDGKKSCVSMHFLPVFIAFAFVEQDNFLWVHRFELLNVQDKFFETVANFFRLDSYANWINCALQNVSATNGVEVLLCAHTHVRIKSASSKKCRCEK